MSDYNNDFLTTRRTRGRDLRPGRDFRKPTSEPSEDRELLTSEAIGASVLGDTMAGGLEPLSEKKPFDTEGTLGGNQQKQAQEFSVDTDDEDDDRGIFDKLGDFFFDKPKDPTAGTKPLTKSNVDLAGGDLKTTEKQTIGDLFHDDTAHAKGHPIHEAAITGHATANLFGNVNDMRPFAQENYEVENAGFFAKTISYSAEVVRDKSSKMLNILLSKTSEAVVDQVISAAGVGPIAQLMKPAIKDALDGFVKNKVDDTYKPQRPLSDGQPNIFHVKEMSDPAVYPFLILGIEFYISKLSETFEAPNLNGIKGRMIRGYVDQVLDSISIGEKGKQFIYYTINAIPNELLTGFRKNINNITELNEREISSITSFVADLGMKYEELFNIPLYRALEQEHAGDTLYELLIGLSLPNTLHEIAQTIEAADSLIYDIRNNEGLFLSIMALMSDQGNKNKLINEFGFLHNVIEGMVYYDRSGMKGGLRLNAKADVDFIIEANKQTEPVVMRETEKDVYIIFRGTDMSNKKDVIQNILQKANSQETTFNPKYNEPYRRGLGMIQEARNKAQAKGGDVKIVGYSMGSYPALYLSLNHPDIETNIYNAYFSQKQQTKNLLTALKERKSNLNVFAVQGDPVSIGLKYYKDLLKPKIIKSSKFFNAHDIRSYLR